MSSNTSLTSAQTLTITVRDFKTYLQFQNCQFNNFFQEFNSFIQPNSYSSIITIEYSQFNYISTCGSIIRNFRQHYQEFPVLINGVWSEPEVYNYRLNSLNYDSLTYQDNQQTTTKTVCTSNCFAINIYQTLFTNFHFKKQTSDQAVFVNPALGLQYHGSVLNLEGFSGPVSIDNSGFINFTLPYQSCNVSQEYVSIDYSSNQDYFVSIPSKTVPQMKSIVSVRKHANSFTLVSNTFEGNTAARGLVYLQQSDDTWKTYPTLISGNTFINNGGYFATVGIFIRAYTSSNIYANMPNSAQQCTGFLIQDNTFELNYGCPQAGGSIFQFECISTNAAFDDTFNIQANDILGTYNSTNYDLRQTILSTFGTTLASIDFETFQPTQNLVGVSTQANGVVDVDMNRFQMQSNIFKENFGSLDQGIVDIYGMQMVYITNETYIGNGESADETLQYLNYSFPISGQKMLLTPSISDEFQLYIYIMESKNQKNLFSILKIDYCSYLQLTSITASSNWVAFNGIIFNSNFYQGQFLSTINFYGSLLLQDSTFGNHSSLVNAFPQRASFLIRVGALSTTASYSMDLPQLSSHFLMLRKSPVQFLAM